MAISYYRTSSAKVTAAGISRIFYGPRVAPTPWHLGQAREIPVAYAGATPDICGKAVVWGRGGGVRWMEELVVDEMELCVAGTVRP